ncbi:hypothetical protein MKQ70_05010 [Chitinophaga sedimenti]|uniref:hypothetical protein n=1 Tax=Chitinophaga sedimenti TaxID=2033606 RepID=UPI002003E5A8|nr:hypothetical protein [Chitinophaga sedimenti]MCK7554397.1 hypothetical protein [Chitinophaga sedimenti]
MVQKGRKGKAGGMPVYPESLKIAVVHEYQTGTLSQQQLCEKYQLRSASTVRDFVRWYEKWSSQPAAPPALPGESESSAALKEAQLRIMALELLIKNAEKELGVDIIKSLVPNSH